jgi:hypothetical protein
VSVIIDFFAAPSHDAAAAVLHGGPGAALEPLEYGNFDVEESLLEWENILTGRRFRRLFTAGQPEVVAEEGDGSTVFAVSWTLQRALADADESRLVEAGRRWMAKRAADGQVLDEEVAVAILTDLAELARGLEGSGGRMYCWVA